MTYELRLADGSVVTHDGTDPINAAQRYVDRHRDAVVVAWRTPRHGLFVGAPTSG